MMKLKLQCFGHLMRRADSLEKTLMLGRREEKRVAEDEIVRQHHRLDGYEFEKILGDGGGQGSLVSAVHGVTKSQTQQLHSNEPHRNIIRAGRLVHGNEHSAQGVVSSH